MLLFILLLSSRLCYYIPRVMTDQLTAVMLRNLNFIFFCKLNTFHTVKKNSENWLRFRRRYCHWLGVHFSV